MGIEVMYIKELWSCKFWSYNNMNNRKLGHGVDKGIILYITDIESPSLAS